MKTKHHLFIHGGWGTREYSSWKAMHRRCKDASTACFKQYGGKGIIVCERWSSFENFLSDMGARPDGTSLERINNEGNYEPSNCRWATPKEQNRNTSRNIMLTAFGQTKCLQDWSKQFNISRASIQWRINHGYCVEDAISLPKQNPIPAPKGTK